MDRLLTVDDVAEILRVSRRTAYGKMKQMIHLPSPLRVTETALRGWIAEQMVDPATKTKAPRRVMTGPITDYKIPRRRA